VRGVHLADWPGLGNGPAGTGLGEEQGPKGKGHMFESCWGAPEKRVPGLWRADLAAGSTAMEGLEFPSATLPARDRWGQIWPGHLPPNTPMWAERFVLGCVC
jgi:hypothetical protein